MDSFGRKTTVALFILINFLLVEGSVRCYKCFVAVPPYYTNATIKLCKDFDYSDDYIVDCPYSTYCMKKITSANLNIPINGTERDCANQKLETKNYNNGEWQSHITVKEPYEEGCSLVNSRGLRTSSIEYCYCKGDLCNSSNQIKYSGYFYVLGILLTLINFNNIIL